MAVNLFTPFTSEQGIALWVSGTTYPLGYQVISPADLNVYVRKVAGAGTTDPKDDATNWKLLTIRRTRQGLDFVATGTSSSGSIITKDLAASATITSSTSGAPTVALDITGSGVISCISFEAATSSAGNYNFSVEVDGVATAVVMAATVTAGQTNYRYLRGCGVPSYNGSLVATYILPILDLPFYKSLKISGYKDSAGMASPVARWAYTLEA